MCGCLSFDHIKRSLKWNPTLASDSIAAADTRSTYKRCARCTFMVVVKLVYFACLLLFFCNLHNLNYMKQVNRRISVPHCFPFSFSSYCGFLFRAIEITMEKLDLYSVCLVFIMNCTGNKTTGREPRALSGLFCNALRKGSIKVKQGEETESLRTKKRVSQLKNYGKTNRTVFEYTFNKHFAWTYILYKYVYNVCAIVY